MQTTNIIKSIIILGLVGTFSSFATFQYIKYKEKNISTVNTISVEQIQILKQSLSKNLGINSDIKVIPTAIKGIFEINVEKQLLYSTIDGHYMFIGNLIDTHNKINLTQQKNEKIQQVKWETLPLMNALKWEKGNIQDIKKRQIAIFADPNCTYCHKMEKELEKVENITVYTFITPILSEDSLQKGIDIWCSKNPSQSWKDWMINNISPVKTIKPCTNPLQENAKLAQSVAVTGTPSIIFMDGSRVSGVMSVDELNKKLNSIK